MAKARTIFVCQSCGAASPKWMGRCSSCGEWDSLAAQSQSQSVSKTPAPAVAPLSQAGAGEQARLSSGLDELDRVLGGGLVESMVVLVGGDPGIGKSTLMLQMAGRLSEAGVGVLYASAEESGRQVGLRAERLDMADSEVMLLAETSLEAVLAAMEQGGYRAVIIDSIQAVRSGDLPGPAGSLSQVRTCAARLAEAAKKLGCAMILVGHVTKDGSLAGPRVLEHLVDTVLYFESEPGFRLRLLRAVKNRFGATDEVGVFEMTDKGLAPVANPSARLMAHRPKNAPGSAVCATLSGTRPLLVEVQALVSPSGLAQPRRQALGVDRGRLHMLCAVLTIHAGLDLAGADVFVNVAGGIKLSEPAADLAVAAALASSLAQRPLPPEVVCFGEVGLAGELRAVSRTRARLNEAARQGFASALCAPMSKGRTNTADIKLLHAPRLDEAIRLIL